MARARAALRAGEYADVVSLTTAVIDGQDDDALAADAYSVRGVALALTGEDEKAQASLERGLAVARALGDPRVEAVALGSSAIAHQRQGRAREARAAYEASLACAEKAGDAATVAAMRLNLAVLARGEGDLALALSHLEAAVDMGRRAGGLLAVQQALLNLANLDIYLGRYARASGSIDSLVAQREKLSQAGRAQLLGLEAELATRTGDVVKGAALYEQAAEAWEAQGRSLDAAESRLEGLLAEAREADPASARGEAARLAREVDTVREKLGDAGFREHGALASLVRGALARLEGQEEAAKRAFDEAFEAAQRAGQREWAWQALDARARLAGSQGSVALARRDTEAALAMLEETAVKLPRDLREVFWNDPRRSALREAHTATMPGMPAHSSPSSSLVGPAARALAASGSTSLFGTGPRAPEDRLARILEITRELATEHEIARLLARVTDHAVALLGAERGFVVLVNDAGELEAHAARDRAGDEPHARFSRSVAEKVVAQGEPVIAVSARDDERLASAVSVHQLMIQSIACVPIRGAPPLGRTIGALYVETRLRPGLRFQDELPTLRAFADQAAIAIENARLLAENRARAEELARANADLEVAQKRLAQLLGKRTEQLAEARRDLKQARRELRSHFGYAGLVGTSAAMRKLYAVIERIKDTDVPVLLIGESGTGKEMVAKAVHAAGPRARKPFLGVNCGAIPGNLLESELFGSVRGAFTGADRDRKGLFREAEGGSILLDEIGEMPQKMQAGLLRVLQEKCVRPVGGAEEVPVDARVIAATNRDLEQMVKEQTFREDLYYRLHVVVLHVPSLRERIEDIPPLIDHFLTIFAARYHRERKTVARDALRRLSSFHWPGNVRQLEHVLLNAWLMSERDEIQAEDLELPTPRAQLPADAAAAAVAGGAGRPRGSIPPPVRASSKAEFKAGERERILSALAACNWNRVAAAKMIGVPRRTFYRRLKEFGIL
jgi:transcriptional regulator with GAF, ATPase, and Fis domain